MRIKATNLFAWESLDYEIEKGLTKVNGFNYDDNNREGCGKSSISNILCWICYGELPKEPKVKIDQPMRHGAKKCSGEIDFGKGNRILRSRKPNKLELWIDGNKQIGKDARDIQNQINEFLGMTFTVFCQTRYFPQDYKKKFAVSSEEDKAKIISEVQDLQIFDRGIKEAKALIKEEKKTSASLEEELQRYGVEISTREDAKEDLDALLHTWKKEKEDRIDGLTDEFENLQGKQNDLILDKEGAEEERLPKEDRDKTNKQIQELEGVILDNEVKLDRLVSDIEDSRELTRQIEYNEDQIVNCDLELKALNLDIQNQKEVLVGVGKQLKPLPKKEEELAELEIIVDDKDDAKDGLSELNNIIKNMQTKQQELNDEVDRIDEVGSGECDKCFSQISGKLLDKKRRAIFAEIDALKKEILEEDSVRTELKDALEGILKAEKEAKVLKDKVNKLKNLAEQAPSIEDLLVRLQRDRNNWEERKIRHREDISKLEKKFESIKLLDSSKLTKKIEVNKAYIKDLEKVLDGDVKIGIEIKHLSKDLIDIKTQVEKVKTKLGREEAKQPTEIIDKIKKEKKKIKEIQKKEKEVQRLWEEKTKYLAQLEELKVSFKEVKSYVFRTVLAELSYNCNRYLQMLYDIPIDLEFTNVVEGELAKIQTKLNLNGQEQSLGLFSGGQGTRIFLATDLALSNLVEKRGESPFSGLRIFDEQLTYLSSESKEKTLKLFESLEGSTLFVEHDSFLDVLVNQTLEIEYRDGISRRV